MFQNLLKNLPAKRSSREGSAINSATVTNQPMQISNGWDDILPTAPKIEQKIKLQQPQRGQIKIMDSQQQPGFLNQLENLGIEIEELQQQQEPMDIHKNNDESAPHQQSPYCSMNELNEQENHPMILSNINNDRKNAMDRLLLMRIRNYVSDLRQTHMELSQYVQDQKTIMEYFQEKICMEVQDFCLEYCNKIAEKFSSSETQNADNYKQIVDTLQNQLRNKNNQYLQLSRELADVKSGFQREQERNKILRKSSLKKIEQPQNKLQKNNGPCANCKILQAKMNSIRQQLKQNEQQIEKLLIQNQRLQQDIFDMDQKVVGIDLEVEKRMKEKSKFSQFSFNKPAPPTINEEQLEQIEQLTEEIAILQEKCKRYQDKSQKETALLEKQRKIEEKSAVLDLREATLTAEKANLAGQFHKIQEERQNNYVREHQILVAEENLSKKIADLRKKQAQLSQWEAELTKKANQSRQNYKDTTLNMQFADDANYHLNSADDLNRSDEISLKSFGRNKNNSYNDTKLQGSPSSQQNITDYKQPPSYKSRNNTQYYQHEQEAIPIRNRIPQLPIRQAMRQPMREPIRQPMRQPMREQLRQPRQQYEYPNDPNYNRPQRQQFDREERLNEIRRNDSKKLIDSNYGPRRDGVEVIPKKYTFGVGSNYRQTRETSPYRNINEPRGRIIQPAVGHQYNLPRNSPKHFRDVSKNSRSSATKSIRGNYNLQTSGLNRNPIAPNPRDPPLTGLGSKLERLREQIKKQIDSIK